MEQGNCKTSIARKRVRKTKYNENKSGIIIIALLTLPIIWLALLIASSMAPGRDLSTALGTLSETLVTQPISGIPVVDLKYNLAQHPNYKLTAHGGAKPYVRKRKSLPELSSDLESIDDNPAENISIN